MTVTYLHSDLEERSRRIVLPEVFDYFAGGASSEETVRRNRSAWRETLLRAAVHQTSDTVEIGVSLLGRRRPTPLVISPMARLDLLGSGNECDAATAAGLCGVSFTASSRSSVRATAVAESFRDTSLHRRLLTQLSKYHRGLYEELVEGERGQPAFLAQLYVLNSEKLTTLLREEARRAESEALVVTLDTPVLGIRMRDIRRGFTVGTGALAELVSETGETGSGDESWWWESRQRSDLSEEVLQELVVTSDAPVFAKGVLTREEVERVLQWGGRGVWISNHGGRQLDNVSSSADALSALSFSEASTRPCEVLVDGGVLSAQAVVVAGCLGATLVGVGRAAAWSFALGGSIGLASYLLELRLEIARSLTLLGSRSFEALNLAYLGRK
jgi:4-hydroxymandelate oxidase